MTHVTRSRLSDGREILYFDEAPGRVPATDLRGLTPRATGADGSGEVRFDALSGEWVAVAAHRQSRTHLPPADECPICPSTPGRSTEIPADDYQVVAFENRFPSLGPVLGEIPGNPGWGTLAPASGRCEVVTFTPSHTGSFAELPWDRARTVVEAWSHRTAELSALPGIRQVFPFENRGADIGVTLHHPHGQIYAYPYVTPRAEAMARTAVAHWGETAHRESLLETVVRQERQDGSRMVLEGEHFSAYVPFAARWPLEVHLAPHRRVPDFAALTPEEKDELTGLYLDLLGRVDGVYGSPTPYIAAWHQAPLAPGYREAMGFHLQLTSPRRAADKLKYLAGSEAAMGAFINDVTPEAVAARLRAAVSPYPAPGRGVVVPHTAALHTITAPTQGLPA
ncbi:MULTISPECIES: galactose-1-phosphate uridylyltransferase [Arthrobacter]|uniref:Galactose-1-phosphate uridylyltransferase n=2 Tax=Arthrobacter TaxID=1663 RepID=A0ABU9KKI4_9MICC|nr:galactose-1-phosphate uridylyltransferase [Arthrobacter sp. YJM1]MDP5227406.1 galactose-1-phosphate uridylyltransferase [Arthrobacter sp. YJM1]